MLPVLCSLLAALSCVSGVIMVTQNPPVLTLRKGENVTIHCNLGTVTNDARWYKQVSGEAPHSSPPPLLLHLLLELLVSSLSTRVPSDASEMLPALCSLLAALSCVSGVIVVTQKPPVLTVKGGEKITMHCNLGTVTGSAARWYKQVPGEAPQFVLRNYHEWSSPRYGSGFSAPKFTSTHSSQSDYTLIISNVEVGDSAVYYCHTYDSSANEEVSHTVVFGQGSKLIVEDAAQPPPVVTLFPPSDEELKSSKATLVCVSQHMSRGFANVRWLVDGSAVTSGVTTGSAVQQPDKKFSLSSYLSVDSSEWKNQDRTFICEVSAGTQPASVKLKRSECGTRT
ncbi:immunoglobulin lambda-1 light chain-like [Trichomycterus rosablanca]|uniref:immunoglobulin lambda-1 light chain-like n=1 Tax=Trichomycterus rosablanca TaxID=2290929 RepID=UPI002F35B9E8